MEDFDKQPFYNRLTVEFRDAVQDLINKRNALFIFRAFEWICWGIALFLIFSNLKTFENNNEVLKSTLIIFLAGGLIIFSDMVIKTPKKNIDKSKEKIQNEMLFDICTCAKRCTCRSELKEYLNGIHIDLNTKEK